LRETKDSEPRERAKSAFLSHKSEEWKLSQFCCFQGKEHLEKTFKTQELLILWEEVYSKVIASKAFQKEAIDGNC
jgi:hypothetical protein